MASAKFLEEALNTDVDESAVSAIVGSLENQLGSSTPHSQSQNSGLQQNHVNSPISNGGTAAPQKHGTIANGDSISASVSNIDKQMNNAFINAQPTITSTYTLQQTDQKPPEGVKVVYTQGGQVMGGQGTIVQGRVATPQGQIPNGAIGMAPQTVFGTVPSTVHQVQQLQQKPPTIVLKTTGNPSGAPGLVTVPVNAVPQSNNGTQGNHTLGVSSQPILSNLPVVNVRPQGAQAKGPARVVLSTGPGLVGSRPGTPQLTLQSFHGLQPGQQGALLLKTDTGYQLLRVGPAPQAANLASSQPGGQPVTFRMPTVAASVSSASTNPAQAGSTTTVTTTQPVVQQTQAVQRPANDNTKEKCRKFLANLLELSSREPKAVERNVRTLIQELIDNKVEPDAFCDKLERLLNASPQPCLIGFLKKSLPLLRHSLATNEMTIDGIRPPPPNVVFSIAGATPTVQTVRPAAQVAPGQVRIVGPGTAVVRSAAPGAVLQQRLVAPIRGPTVQQQPTRMVTAIRQPGPTVQQVTAQTISSSQPPALHPVFSANQAQQQSQHTTQQQPNQPRPTVPRPVQVRPAGQGRPPPQRLQTPSGGKVAAVGGKALAGQGASRPTAKEKEKKGFSTAYSGDDDINDVAAMGGVNLAEETQKILGPTEYVGTQIRSCKEDIMCSSAPFQYKIRQVMQRHGLDDPSTGDVAACISHAAQERLRDMVEKLAVITEHRLEIVKSDFRYEVTHNIKGQLKFLEDVDKAVRKRKEELEREQMLRAAKSRSKTEDPEQAKLKAKAKEMQRVEMEELRQKEANATALQAIGPRKKPKLEGENSAGLQNSTSGPNNTLRGQMPLRQRIKKVTMRDLHFLFESEKDSCRSKLLYKSYLK
ncbi:transcription initiation factor TFIID subunit 4 isoform X1 [Sitophilus oryzae]|uniref:Transcription initiation factor TFIID subunit 4 isoform X1 n=1 Tax=Sitophilus oryzae TaxID=7048 RepID=A0A6J2XXQ5_SITOR|nr:transcription initiation factor TFIID subunit 4 isoform X1 [Sitophilus oryzae]